MTSLNLDNQNTADIFEMMLPRMRQYYGADLDLSYQEPGVALLELFSLLKDMQQFYMNYVSDEHKLAYIRLLGFDRHKVEPARTILEFRSESLQLIPKGHTAKAGNIPFETTRELPLSANRIAALALSRQGEISSVQNGEAFYPFGKPVDGDNALLIGFATAISRAECLYFDVPAQQVALGCLCVEALTGENQWEDVDFKDCTDCLKDSGYVYIFSPASMAEARLVQGFPPLFWVRVSLADNSFMLAPHVNSVTLNTVPAVQYETVTCDIELGHTNGIPNQRLHCPYGEVLSLEIRTKYGTEEWTEVEQFYCSGATDRHFRTDGELIIFGNDEQGAAAPPGTLHLLKYRLTLGGAGNLPAGSINDACHDGLTVCNIKSSAGGIGASGMDEIIEEIRRDSTKLYRAVTLDDYCRIVKAMPELAIDTVSADMEDGVIVLYIKPESDMPLPLLNDTYKKTLLAYLEPFRMLTAQIRLDSPIYLGVKVKVEFELSEHISNPKERITEQLHTLFPAPEHANVFRDSISNGEVYGLIAHLPFMGYIKRLVLECGGSKLKSGFLPLGAGVIPYLEEVI